MQNNFEKHKTKYVHTKFICGLRSDSQFSKLVKNGQVDTNVHWLLHETCITFDSQFSQIINSFAIRKCGRCCTSTLFSNFVSIDSVDWLLYAAMDSHLHFTVTMSLCYYSMNLVLCLFLAILLVNRSKCLMLMFITFDLFNRSRNVFFFRCCVVMRQL